MKKPIFTISLDFELHWGRFDKYPLQGSLDYYKETRKVIPYILELFEKYDIQATWATVGSLMAESQEEWQHYCPEAQPSYLNTKYSAYEWLKREKFIHPEALFAPELVREVIACPGQEIGSHTFAHYYTREKGQLTEQFRADLRAAQQLAKEKFLLDLQSLVFPRNQFHDEAIQVAYEEGFDFIRSNPTDWFWKRTEDSGLLKRLFRTGDTIVGLGNKSHYPITPLEEGKPLLLPASRLLRPYRGEVLFHKQRLKRIKDELQSAAQAGHVYHLWWHPHNFGLYPRENLLHLESLFQFFESLKDTYGMSSLNMKNTTINVV